MSSTHTETVDLLNLLDAQEEELLDQEQSFEEETTLDPTSTSEESTSASLLEIVHNNETADADPAFDPPIALSARNISREKLTSILSRVSEECKTPLQLDIAEVTMSIMKKYTSNHELAVLIIQFFQDECAFCPTDHIRTLRQWGQPTTSQVAMSLQKYAIKHNKHGLVKQWGKPLCAIWRHLCVIIWPNTHSRNSPSKLQEYRKMYGFILRSKSQETTPLARTPAPKSKRSTAGGSTRKRIFMSPLDQNPQRSKHRRTSSTPSGNFSPYYDILYNQTVYMVRIFLPLMKPKAVNALKFSVNMGRRQCTVEGCYWPSTLIGEKAAKVVNMRVPLLPSIYAPEEANGTFYLEIGLPSDIKDDDQAIQVVHDSWGVLLRFRRRKIVHEAHIVMSSCFGGTTVSTPNSTTTRAEQKSPALPQTRPTAPFQVLASPTVELKTVVTADPKSLIGREVQVCGSQWGDAYKDRKFTGSITSTWTGNDDVRGFGYEYFKVSFEDCTEDFCLDELLEKKFITDAEHAVLAPACIPSRA